MDYQTRQSLEQEKEVLLSQIEDAKYDIEILQKQINQIDIELGESQ